MNTGRIVVVGILLAIAVLTYGCAGSSQYMKPVSSVETGITTPSENESIVVFMRPSGFGFAVQSPVFDLSDNDEKLVGIVSAKKRVAYRAIPGQHLFMVVGESADFMKANLQPAKTYYALVTPRMGTWKARFSLKPVAKNELNSDEFKDWLNVCDLTENTPEAYDWAKNNATSVRAKRVSYWNKWNERAETEKPSLNLEDGR